MSPAKPDVAGTALALRRDFDASFAQAPRTETGNLESLLALRIGGDGYAIRVAEIGGLYVDRRIMPLPTTVPELLGVAGFRGQIAPVYDLAVLLGYARQTSPRWLILARFRIPVALAFDAFDAHFSALPERIFPSVGKGLAQPHLCDAVHTDDAVRPIIQLRSLLEDIQRRADLPVRQGRVQA